MAKTVIKFDYSSSNKDTEKCRKYSRTSSES